MAATWLASGLGDAVEFFVDEDPAPGRPAASPAILGPSGSARGGVPSCVRAGSVGCNRLPAVGFQQGSASRPRDPCKFDPNEVFQPPRCRDGVDVAAYQDWSR